MPQAEQDSAEPPRDWADETEAALLDAALRHAPDLGWTAGMVERAARDVGLSPADAELLAPHGPRDLAALLSRRHDAQALQALAALDPKAMKVRERIIRALEARLEAAAADAPAARRWAGFLALPVNTPLGLKLAWAAADALWRWAGDTATDENHYSKRAILSGILLAALPLRLEKGREAAQRFIYDRVGEVMKFEAWKAGLPKASGLAETVAGALGRLRYGR